MPLVPSLGEDGRELELSLMEKSLKRALGSTDNSRLLGIVAAVVVIATLYFARIVFIPLALALLLSLVLSPPVAFLEKIKLPRALAIFLVVILMVGLMGLVGWKTSQQFVDLTDQLPSYRNTLEDKIRSLKGPGSESLKKASDTVFHTDFNLFRRSMSNRIDVGLAANPVSLVKYNRI